MQHITPVIWTNILPGPVVSRVETSAIEAWKKEARELAERQEQITNASRDDLRKALIELDTLLRNAPGSVHKAYRNLTEKRIEEARESFTDSIGDGHLSWSLSDETPELAALRMGGLIREIDRVLAERRSQWPIAPSEWHLEQLGCWFIPRQGVSALRPARRLQAYSKRGLLFHRILSATLGPRNAAYAERFRAFYDLLQMSINTSKLARPSEVTRRHVSDHLAYQ
ncbi:hypothetical protein WN73_18445 [Bradyrhizobium sp. CCBAU 45394]|nr:hypothetical protein [Bradyrhizobium sp. CCBAU 45394]MDA9534792.1 hypothetical protein [Bradyrhizobium sp. CCBAU 21362]